MYIYIIMFTIINQHPWSFIKLTGARTYNGSPLAAHRCSTATSLVQKHLTYRTHWTTHWQNIPQISWEASLGWGNNTIFSDTKCLWLRIFPRYEHIYLHICDHQFLNIFKNKNAVLGHQVQRSPLDSCRKSTLGTGRWLSGGMEWWNEEAKHAVCMYTNLQKTIHMQSYVHFSISAFFAYLYYELYYNIYILVFKQ